MIRRLGVAFALLGLLGLVAVTVPATGQEDFERHPHMLVQRPVIDLIEFEGDLVPALVGFRKCTDLAANRTVPLHAHHVHLHFGDSGVSFDGASGHVVVGAAPFPAPFEEPVPWSNCEEFAAILPLPLLDE